MNQFVTQPRATKLARRMAQLEETLLIIAEGQRADGTFNRDREGVRQLALQALHRLRRDREESGDCTRRGCDGQMLPGIATGQTVTGSADFADGEVVTMGYGGPGRIVACRKCNVCGHSVTV